MNKTFFFASMSGIALVATLAGCAQSDSHPDTHRQIGMANPASVYCLSLKGQLENVTTAQGVKSYCTLPSGERVEEWALFRRDHPQKAN
ncbi:putative hemolysin [Rosenbergiella nectarea]|uniref:putative hemolysin n=1 Tax=Rosenbergiella nectarea TaxID=988801 RepID=UPI00240E8A49|nr:DUF333 domain-containing protein [Rosenbergiella nectarea]